MCALVIKCAIACVFQLTFEKNAIKFVCLEYLTSRHNKEYMSVPIIAAELTWLRTFHKSNASVMENVVQFNEHSYLMYV